MKRQKRAPRPQKKKTATTAAATIATKPTTETSLTRRAMLGKLQTFGIAAAVIGGGGLLLTRSVNARMYEHDLDRIGQGVPMVVQVHDPQCNVCVMLQNQTRKAMRAFDEDELQYVIADLTKPEGRALAIEHSVGKTTLLLFDGKGTRRSTLPGVRDSGTLESTFRAHIGGGTGS